MRNIVFDMGNVLINYDPEHFIVREGIADPGDRALLLREIFRSAEWPMQDRGEMDEAELEARVLGRIPARLHAAAHRLIFCWDDPIEPVPDMAGFIAECRQKGLGIYLLSNASRRQWEYWPRIPGSEYFDGAVVSAFEGCAKPAPRIYRRLLERYRLEPGDCLFVDDVPENVAGGVAAGMKGFLFTGDVEALRAAAAD